MSKENRQISILKLGSCYASKYAKYKSRRDALRSQIETAKQELEMLRCPDWIKEIIEPIAKELGRTMPNRNLEILGPFGLCGEVGIHFYKEGINDKEKFDGDNCISITLIPGELEEGQILIRDTSKNTHQFASGTIGEMNGLNYPSIRCPEFVNNLLPFLS